MGVDVTYAIPVPESGQQEARARVGAVLTQAPRLARLLDAGALHLSRDLLPHPPGSYTFPPLTTELVTVQSLARFIAPDPSSRHWGYWPTIRDEMEALLEAVRDFPELNIWYLPDTQSLESGNDLTVAASQGIAHRVSPEFLDKMDHQARTQA